MSTQKQPLKAFLCHASADKTTVYELYRHLQKRGILPWLDTEDLVGGQNWREEIPRAIRASDAIIICLSKNSISKEGFVHAEIAFALEKALEIPQGDIFIIPARLEECEVPNNLESYQWVDLFEQDGFVRLMKALKARATDLERSEVQVPQSDESGPNLTVISKENPERQETSPTERVRRNRRRRRRDSTITAALIGVLGTLLVALIQIYANRPPPLTPTPMTTVTFAATATDTPTPTATATHTPTFTPVPATDTPLPSPTGVPPVDLGKDWLGGCISTLWKPYPADIPVNERGDGCWHEPVHVFFAENGDLDFLAERRNGPVEIYGLFAPLPERGTVTFTVRLRDLRNVDLWMGVFAEPDVNSQGLLITIPAGDVRRRVIVQRDPLTDDTITGTRLLDQENGYSISFTFTANSARSTVNPSVFVMDSASVPSAKKWLFLGYKGLTGSYRIDGTFLSFELK